MDGSLWAFILITGSRKEYLLSFEDLSNIHHKEEYLSNVIEEKWGPKSFLLLYQIMVQISMKQSKVKATMLYKEQEKTGHDPTTIRRFIDKYKKTGKTENLPRSGWPPAINDNEKNALINEVTKN
ncbi:hypothetical protein RhiirA4_487249 [Rhizophagus irregularis]|uniref:Uncharacterized protein n=1 Tax=Rhizophagus irregularis TaxID=588596 RepID=A0A2I1HSB0_9GLOM|nr:hypothetical protein RhiirA4_487249 [Rhizophagus irregularis]